MPRLKFQVQGVVQGVGFRPYVFRLAHRYALTGWVRNRPEGVEIEVQGGMESLSAFAVALEAERPAAARLHLVQQSSIPEGSEASFTILESAQGLSIQPSVPPDLALCLECECEISDPGDRRYRYPFTNCTHCGPRYSLIAGLPYDRSRTGMAGFPLCEECRKEYENPLDRRFHAEPVACPKCGPKLRFLEGGRPTLQAGFAPEKPREGDEALRAAVECLSLGRILALKGLGGFQLLVDAGDEAAVNRLRRRKHREEKPFAVMFPSLGEVRSICEVSPEEAALLSSPEAPILLLKTHAECEGLAVPDVSSLASSIAPGNPRLGVMLPYTPLHRLLLDLVKRPLVCTSGNISEEPMAIHEEEAREQLGCIADAFLVHDRPILRPVDDSVLRLDADGPVVLRRARGYAPLAHPFTMPVGTSGKAVLALGAHQKSTVTLVKEGQAVVSQHLGDLHSLAGVRLLERTVEDLLDFLGAEPSHLACDAHPDYASTRLVERLVAKHRLPLLRVQHHHAHIGAVMAEFALEGPVLGLAFDGSGWGPDGTVWGGEALRVDGASFQRLGHLRTFPLPGGERAVKDPLRSAAGLLWEALGSLEPLWMHDIGGQAPSGAFLDRSFLEKALTRNLQTPRTSSMGRLFDAVSAIIGLRQGPGFEGQAAMALEFTALEFAALGCEASGVQGYAFGMREGTADFTPMLRELLQDRAQGVAPGFMALRFHQALADLALAWAEQAAIARIVLAGGCFQNSLLLRLTRARLQQRGFEVIRPKLYPVNDGAISLGQAWVAARA